MLLTWIIGLPLAAALLIALVRREVRFGIRLIALGATLVTLLLALVLFLKFQAGLAGYQFELSVPWVKAVGINYHVGVDGINVGLIFMAALVAFAATCVSWEIQSHEKEFYILLLVMAGGILGAFASLDLFFFYFFHELALVPTFIMIGVWGRGENKNYATFNLTLYLGAGSLIALIGLIALYLQVPASARTFDLVELSNYFKTNPMPASAQHVIFGLLLVGFGVLVALWPFHTWAAPGYAAAPAPTAMLHAGALKKFGLYGLIRIGLPLMPQGAQDWMGVLAWLCLGNILYCGWIAMRQRELNLVLGNSSIAHMGFVFLGIASLNIIGVTGAVLIMVAHGLLAALSFGLSGYVYRQTGTLDLDRLGGLLRRLPFIGAALVMAAFAGCGLPGFANFPGELLVLFGAWRGLQPFVAVAIWGGIVVAAIYMLRAVRSAMHGPMPETWANAQDASLWRKVPFALLIAALLLFGCWPRWLTDKIQPSAQNIVKLAAPPANGVVVNHRDTEAQRNPTAKNARNAKETSLGVSALGQAPAATATASGN
jgi:NADH-quinone oxidoreductase subunit M